MKPILSLSLIFSLISGPIFADQSTDRSTKSNSNVVNVKLPGKGAQRPKGNTAELSKLDPVMTDSEMRDRAKAAMGVSDPGGQGGIRTSVGFQTMAEAGLALARTRELIPPTELIYLINQETKDELKAILNEIPLLSKPLKGELYQAIIATRDRFIDTPNVNLQIFNKIRDEYVRQIRSQGQNLDPSAFALPAFSASGKTYIITSVFNNELNERQRALVLVHEFFMRTKTSFQVSERLKRTLQIDAELFQLLSSPNSKQLALDLIQDIHDFQDDSMRIIRATELVHYRILSIIQDGNPVLMSDLVMDPAQNESFETRLRMTNYSLVYQKFEARSPGATIALKNKFLDFDSRAWESRTAYSGLEEYCQKFKNKLSQSDVPGDSLVFAPLETNEIVRTNCALTRSTKVTVEDDDSYSQKNNKARP